MDQPAAVPGTLLDFLPILIGFLWAWHGVGLAQSVTEDDGSTTASVFAIRRSACGHVAITWKQTTDEMEEDGEDQSNLRTPTRDSDYRESNAGNDGLRNECGIGGKQLADTLQCHAMSSANQWYLGSVRRRMKETAIGLLSFQVAERRGGVEPSQAAQNTSIG